MAKKAETVFKERVTAALDRLSYCWYEKIQQVTIRGTPDLIACINGKFIAIELKASAEAKIDEIQKYKLQQIKNARGYAIIVHPGNWVEVLEVLTRLSSSS